MAEKNLEHIIEARKEKLKNLRRAGTEPYPARVQRTHTIREIIERFDELFTSKEKVSIVGRIYLLRPHGKIIFADVEDDTGRFQILLKEDTVGEESYRLFANIDVGDFLEAKGEVFLTSAGEKTLGVLSYRILAKSLRPLPEKWHGLKDLEQRLRRRYVDLTMNKDVRELFRRRALLIQAFRKFYAARGFMEVETPVLELVPGGADANPFTTRHDALDQDFYLRISLELPLKRLIVGGYEAVFEIGPVFRNEGMSTEHLQEFTMLESYWAYHDWMDMMSFIEELYRTAVKQVFDTHEFTVERHKVNFEEPWDRVDYRDIFQKGTGIDLRACETRDDLVKEIKKQGLRIEMEKYEGKGRLIDRLYKLYVRPKLIGPAFLVRHPVDVSPLAKRSPDDPTITERFQVLLAGSEVGNGWSELNDPLDQRQRFEEQAKLREAGDKEAQMYDEDFVQALEYGMPPTVGFGVGIDRLFTILAGLSSIKESVFFPMMKPEKD